MNYRNTNDLLKRAFAAITKFAAVLTLFCVFGSANVVTDKGTPAGTVISNRAEATYQDETGQQYSTVSQLITVTVLAVPAINVTPDETVPSQVIAPNERITRSLRICNTGNAEDAFMPVRADISAPAVITNIYFDIDNSGTVTNGDIAAEIGRTQTPRLAPGACQSMLFVIETNAVAPQSQVSINLTARSMMSLPGGGFAQDSGRIINSVGSGVTFTAPGNANLSPIKLVENAARATAAAGQILNYSIAFRNSGGVSARQTRIVDELPAELEYVANTLRLNNRSLTDAADADEGSTNAKRIELLISEIAPDAVTQIQFQARLKGANLNGSGVVNFATVSAANAPLAKTSDAVVIVSPIGTVYAGNSAGGVRIAGAKITLATDENGTLSNLTSNIGFAPNAENINPLSSDTNGNFSFALDQNQIGAAGNPVRYFVTVTAPNYRPRLLEISIVPSGANGFYQATIRSLDGQSVAIANGFELTTSTVRLSNLAALVFNIPMFDLSNLEISKSSDKQFTEIGDIISYRLQVRNATSSTMRDVSVRDLLPATFAYASGTARIQTGRNIRNAEPAVNGNEMTFELGELEAGISATITYRVRVGANTREGDHVNSATVSGVHPNGERVVAPAAQAMVRVKGGVFSMRQIVIGRVFEDKNGNGKFDEGERPVSGARVYTNNGMSVVTDTAGQYNIPAVSPGSIVLTLDPITLPDGYNLLDDDGRKSSKSWTRLLRTPLGGGSLLRQNFAIAPQSPQFAISDEAEIINAKGGFAASGQNSNRAVEQKDRAQVTTPENITPTEDSVASAVEADKTAKKRSSGTYTVEATENVEAVAAGNLLVLSPKRDEVVMSPSLSIDARVANNWTIEALVNGERIDAGNIGETRVDNRNQVTTFSFVGINMRPGVNTVKLTAVGANAERGQTTEFKVYGRGAAEKLEIIPMKTDAAASGNDSIEVEIRAFDRLGNPAADGQISVETSAGRIFVKRVKNDVPADANDFARQRMISLENGSALVQLVGDGTADVARLKAIAGRQEATAEVRFTNEMRPSLMVGLAEYSFGRNAPEISSTGDDENTRGRLAFYYRGQVFGKNLLTLAYDSQQPLNRVAGRDRVGGFDPLDRAYPIFGDSSQRFEDAQSNSKLYARLDRGRSYAMFGDMEADLDKPTLTGYSRRLTGVKLHLENSNSDFITVTGARPDTAFARDVIPGGGLSLVRLSHGDILPGSESVALEVRDRRNPEIILTRENLIRSVDYNLNSQTGEIFFLRPISTFDHLLNLTQIVVSYEYRGAGSSNYVYTGRAQRTFNRFGLRVGASYVNQQQGEVGAFQIGGVDVEKKLPNGGLLSFEAAMSNGRFASGVNVFDFYNSDFTSIQTDETARERNGMAVRVKIDQPLPFFQSRLRADFQRSGAGFYNPFGATIASGNQRLSAGLDMRPTDVRNLAFGFMDERNETANVNNSRQTFSALWSEQWRGNLRTVIGFDHRRYGDELTDRKVNSNLITAAVEYRPTEKLELSLKREQNLGEADPTYPDQTTIAANYELNPNAKLFFTQRLASAPITPIGDFSNAGFASVGSRRETAFGIETKISRLGALSGRYQIENGINGTDSFAVVGLQNRWELNKTLAVEAGFERGFLLKGTGSSFNSATFGASWTPVDGFRTTARYELRDRNGLGQLLALGAVGKIGDNWTTMARGQWARSNFSNFGASSSNITVATAYRPLESDKYALLFSYNRRHMTQTGMETNGVGQPDLRDNSDTLSTDGLYQVNRNLELYGRFALRFAGNGNDTTAYASALTFQGQLRAQQRLTNRFDVAAEGRWLAQPSSHTFRRSFGAEVGLWALPDLRLGAGYNFTQASQFDSLVPNDNRQFKGGFYFTVSSKLSNVFNLFGTSKQGLEETPAVQQDKGDK